MQEILRTNDMVLLSYAIHVLSEEGIPSQTFDQHTSIMEGSIGAIPRRLMVLDDDYSRAKAILGNASITSSDA